MFGLGNKHLIKVSIWKVRSSWAYISFNTIQGKTRRKLTGKILQFNRTRLWTHSSLVTNFTIFWYDGQHRISMCQPQWLNHNVWTDWKKKLYRVESRDPHLVIASVTWGSSYSTGGLKRRRLSEPEVSQLFSAVRLWCSVCTLVQCPVEPPSSKYIDSVSFSCLWVKDDWHTKMCHNDYVRFGDYQLFWVWGFTMLTKYVAVVISNQNKY